ncbi:polyamine ABC transporter substrate-binding protein [Sinorhizobium meliloti]|uniref:polyamine ABC transporter substrate-binding protein n=1 Tax=Rhizobium meliloti TaxID=382 RepID=UPI000FDB6DEE|nr:ABC transporter substrate-binding protein [Sinorhizobium meliloti]MDE3823003.1 polyamine ABC transporter substrate-binding protein [Sinorhizobium meliloti]RVM41544.1 extracellular solute-binding protein [Sinorhizobium meliloti]RVN59153.1 extracellular solute-binding protein [Sinorhizobium meliloti]RVO29085.1 extracellular solute-binding protein [Sinorhizobium meliloti]RVP53789.1 extracellular solute-binding protein [Sinorhizobium meliloti]
MRNIFILAATVATIATSTPATAADLVFSSWGGTTQDAQKAAWADKFTEKTGINVLQDGPTDYGKLKAMVEANAVTWDVVDVEGDYAAQAGKKGLLEKLDFSVIDKSKLDPRFVTDYSVGSFYYSFVIGCNKDVVDACPKTWADLFDTEKFAGKRAFYKWSAPGVIEAALLADGVPADKLYPLDLDRAFKKLDTIKGDIIWWSGGAQSQQLLASAEAPFGSLWNGRMTALAQTGVSVETSWEQNITAADSLVVPKGAKNKEAAMQFIALATSAEAQAELANLTGYAPINLDSPELMDADLAKTLPDAQTASQVNADMNYWAENRDAIGERWYAWQAK